VTVTMKIENFRGRECSKRTNEELSQK
jgi:hypothetical protein